MIIRARLEMRREDGANEKLVFHGTTSRCFLVDGDSRSPCVALSCSFCCILRGSFLVSKAGSAGRTFKRCDTPARLFSAENVLIFWPFQVRSGRVHVYGILQVSLFTY